MGIAVVGGMLVSTLLTLYIVPAIYSYVSTDRSKRTKKRSTMNMKRGLITLLAALLCIAAAAQERQPQPGHAETTHETGNGTARSGRRAPGGGIRPAALRETWLRRERRSDGRTDRPRTGRRAGRRGGAFAARMPRKGLERNYDIRIVRNEERITDNDATAANAGMLPTIDLSAGYGSNVNRIRTTPREGDVTTAKGVYDGTFDAGVALNWTLFDGFRIRADYRKLQELKEKGAFADPSHDRGFHRLVHGRILISCSRPCASRISATRWRSRANGSASPRRGITWAVRHSSTCCRPAWTSMPTARSTCRSRRPS